MQDYQAIDVHIDEHLDQHVDELSKLCAIPSVAAQNIGMEEGASLVAEMLRRRGFETQILPTDGQPVVYAAISGAADKTLIFYNHYDVQPAEPLELWNSSPFEATLNDGMLIARGVSDDKGHIQCRLAALDAILETEGELPCNIKFLIEGEEEIGSINLPVFIENNKDLLAADVCLWEFGRINHQGRSVQDAGLRGICYVELSVSTAKQDAHSGIGGSIFPNAAWRLTWALGTLKDENEHILIPGFYDKVLPPSEYDLELLGELPEASASYKETYGIEGFLGGVEGGVEFHRQALFEPTCTICGLTSGYQLAGSKTVLPARASAKVDFRLVPDQHPDEILKLLRAHLDQQGFADVEIELLGGEPPGRTDPRDPFLQLVVQTAEDVYGEPQLLSPMMGGSGPNHAFLHTLKLPVATAGIGYPDSRAHAPNENILLDHFIDGAKHTARIVKEYAAGD